MVGGAGIVLAFALQGSTGAPAGWMLDDGAERRAVRAARIVRMTVIAFTAFSPDQTTILKEQMEQIWGPEGITIRWACENEDNCLRIVLIDQRGFAAPDRRNPYACLGSIPFLASGPVRTLYVAVNRIRGLVRESVHFNTPEAVRELIVARAAGRAAAHELAHYLLATPEHAREGLLRSTFSPEDLLGAFLEPFRLTNEQRNRLGLGSAPARAR